MVKKGRKLLQINGILINFVCKIRKNMNRKIFITAVVSTLLSAAVSSCSHLSAEAKKIAGNYYIPEISEKEPLMELNPDGKCLIRAIRPGVLSYTVEGKWDVRNDSVIVVLEPSTLQFEGDSLLIGEIPTRASRRIVKFDDINLELENDGVHYIYHRRNNI